MSKQKTFFITTPIYYVNARPHIGHAYATIATDVLARFYRQKKKLVFFLTGTDEHGAKVAKTAREKGLSPQKFADKISQEFKTAWQELGISFDYFIRTTAPFHIKYVKEFLSQIYQRGDIYAGEYHGLYCVGCEEYKTKDQIKDGKCLIHQTECEEVKEPVYFFKLSRYQKKLVFLIKTNRLLILPPKRRNEILSFLKKELQDVAISRSKVEWGIPLPWDKSQTVYVWVDALLNYLSVFQSASRRKFWPADLHIIGKDILRFHTVIWPALLLAAGRPLPKKIFVHGFFTIGGQKISKSLKNVIDPLELTAKFGNDALRYFLLREFSFGEDGDFSLEKLKNRYRNELANDLGNLVQRVLTLVKKDNLKATHKKVKIPLRIEELISDLKFKEALDEIWLLVNKANRAIDQEKPWALEKRKRANFLSKLLEQISIIAESLAPFLPETSREIKTQIKTLKIKPLFPKQ